MTFVSTHRLILCGQLKVFMILEGWAEVDGTLHLAPLCNERGG